MGLNTLLAGHAQTLVAANGTFAPNGAIAITGNLTVTGQTAAGFVSLTVTPDNAPLTSTLNFPLGDTRANGFTTPLNVTPGSLGVTYSAKSGSTNVTVDLTGYFVQ